MESGIYRIYSIATGESYYGSSKNLHRREIEHRSQWRRNQGNHKIRSLLLRYGIDNFIFEIMEYCEKELFEQKEQQYIKKEDKCLNVWVLPFSSRGCKLGNNVKGKNSRGLIHTEENRKKRSESMKNYYKTHEGYWKGKSIPVDVRNKISETLKNKNQGGLL